MKKWVRECVQWCTEYFALRKQLVDKRDAIIIQRIMWSERNNPKGRSKDHRITNEFARIKGLKRTHKKHRRR